MRKRGIVFKRTPVAKCLASTIDLQSHVAVRHHGEPARDGGSVPRQLVASNDVSVRQADEDRSDFLSAL